MHTHVAGNNLNVDAFYPVSEQAAPAARFSSSFTDLPESLLVIHDL
jgi:hypothetical protein